VLASRLRTSPSDFSHTVTRRMPFPKQKDVEVPLLQALSKLGGKAKPRDIYPVVSEFFPDLTTDEQEQRMESDPGTRKWWNLVQWARQSLVEKGEIDRSTRGIWKITPVGLARLNGAGTPSIHVKTEMKRQDYPSREFTLRDLANANRDEVKSRLITELKSLSSRGFEYFCMEFLQLLGYRNMAVTRRSSDGGIDGYGDFRQGAVSIKSAFQAKRWTTGAVGRPEIDKLRGAIQGDFDHGVFITTSRFTKDAKEASYKKGAITILLLDGLAIAELMIERGIGVTRQPVYLHELDMEFFKFADD
jgi:restriction system protein